MFQFDHSPDLPAGSDLLTDLGIDPTAPSERSPRTSAPSAVRSAPRPIPSAASPASSRNRRPGALGEAAPAEPGPGVAGPSGGLEGRRAWRR